MKYVPNIVGVLLGLLFIASGATFLLGMVRMPAMPEGTPAAMYMGAFLPTGYFHFVKVLEVLGGVLVAIPRTRNYGLLVLGPIIVNILAFEIFIMKGVDLAGPGAIPMLLVALPAAYLLWHGRKAFAGLLN
jgi:putative oxidoreductase